MMKIDLAFVDNRSKAHKEANAGCNIKIKVLIIASDQISLSDDAVCYNCGAIV